MEGSNQVLVCCYWYCYVLFLIFTYYYLSLRSITYYYLLLLIITYYYLLLVITTYYYLLLLIITYEWWESFGGPCWMMPRTLSVRPTDMRLASDLGRESMT